MTSENYDRVKQLFLRVCSLDEADRSALLDRECAGDAELREKVQSLLAHHLSGTVLDSRQLVPATPASSRVDSLEATARRAVDVIWREAIERKGTYLLATAAMLVLLLGGVWSHYGVERSLREVLRDELQTVLEADVTALDLWLREQKAEAKRWARQPDVRAPVAELVRIARVEADSRAALLASPALTELRAALDAYVEEEEGRTGWAVIDRAGLVLAARTDDDVGLHLNAEGMADNAHAFAGETRVAKPHPRGSFVVARAEQVEVPMIYVGTPVVSDDGTIIASLNLGVRADDQFTAILSVGQIGRSGETYAFDERGRLLSDSRFTNQLKTLGLIPNTPSARAIFNLELRDPGVDLTTGAKALASRGTQPLIKMAQYAIAGEDGYDVDGYRGYRGVKVIGAWRWLPEYGFGVGTAVDYSEAYAPLRYPIIASWLPLGVLIVAASGLLYSALRIARLQRQIGVARQLGQYTLEEKIGEGGMGVVYRARHAFLRRPTAVKLLKPDHMNDVSVARFQREVQLASQLTHPNTIEIYDFGHTADGVFYYAMEFLPGVSLAQLINIEGPVPTARVVYILKQICGSLAEAHAIGLVHRDIKPHNIMLCERGGEADFVKVLDFGLVKAIDKQQDTELTAPTALTGTPLYMAPERLKNPLATDPRSDLYSLAAVAYNLLTAHSIYDCTADLDILYHVMNVVPTPPAQLNADIPAELNDLIVASLAKDPRDRPASVDDFRRTLETIPGLGSWTQSDAQAWWEKHAPEAALERDRSMAVTQDFVTQASSQSTVG